MGNFYIFFVIFYLFIYLYIEWKYGGGCCCRYASVMAIESTTKVDDEQWLAYWILYSFLTLMEMLLQPILKWYLYIYIYIYRERERERELNSINNYL